MKFLWKLVYFCNWYMIVQYCFAEFGVTKEYCNSEQFNPHCGSGEVIVMESAYYGLMNIGGCIDVDSDYIGCSSNELDHLDKKCSGRQECKIIVGDASMKASLNCSIPKLYTRYLEAKYICQKVTQVSEQCDSPKNIPLKSGRSIIASRTTVETGCGVETKPYIIQAKTGQKIKVTLKDFNWNPIHENIKGCVRKYGYLIDGESNRVTDICGKTKKNKHIFTSQGSSLQFVIDANILREISFLVIFEVIGCPKFESPKDTWTKESNGIVTVGCTHNDKTWKMRCIGNHWIGIVGKCEKDAVKHDKTVPPIEEYQIWGLPPVVSYVLIAGLFLIIICVAITIAVGFFCIRKPAKLRKTFVATPSNQVMLPLVEDNPAFRTINRTTVNGQTMLTGNVHDGIMTQRDVQNGLIQNNQLPYYFVVDRNGEIDSEPIYDAVYQNV